MTDTVGIVGLGMIARFHTEALEQLPNVDVVGGVDVDSDRTLTYRGEYRPVYGSVDELADLSPSTIIIATPTPTHYEICARILAQNDPPGLLIVEKPIGSSLEQVEDLLGQKASTDVIGVYHAAHAPEVLWAASKIQQWRERFGAITSYSASFGDSYRDLDARYDRVYVNSWIDSGVNALSIAIRFVRLTAVDELVLMSQRGSTFRAAVRFRVDHADRVGDIGTTWDVTAPAKHSAFGMADNVRLYLDHQAMRGVLRRGAETVDEFSYTGDRQRLQEHYLNAFRSIFVERSGCATAGESMLLHRLLFSPVVEKR
jgi:hypothetical protein